MKKYLIQFHKLFFSFSRGKIILLMAVILAGTIFVKAQSPVDVQVNSMLISPSPMVLGSTDPIWLQVNVRRNNKVMATGVVLTIDLPDGIRFESVRTTYGLCSFANKAITCNLGTLDRPSLEYDASFDIYLRPSVRGLFAITSHVFANESDPNLSNNFSTVQTIISSVKGNKRVRAIFTH